MTALILAYLATGAFSGLLAGLFGVGGGLVIVPVLVLLLPGVGVSADIAVQMAIGTSLAVISLTSISSTWAHHRHGGVMWPVFARLAPGLLLGAYAGAWLAHGLDGAILMRIVGIGALLVAAKMAFDLKPTMAKPVPGTPVLLGVGGLIGSISALIGIGGGSLTVPFLSGCSLEMRKAVGTSAACGLPIAMAGALGYIVAGRGVVGRPDGSLGYVSLPGFAIIALSSVALAPIGARLAHRLSPALMRRAFALLLVVIGLKMLLG
ncbi:MAG: sulfite exporter TauE/SafE family protein [Gammaproteobacteria bacterium]|nr:sulfite exporter TauE/SafE family protein [Gammaproteobacteria bacterium]